MSLLDLESKINEKLEITSPRSIEAMRRQGILQNELWIKNEKELKEHYGIFDIDRESMEVRKDHYELRRKEKL